MADADFDRQCMARALALAARGEGYVEPNPMVGCVIARNGRVVAEGWHRRFGGPHAEIEALHSAGTQAADATLYVTLEPCCHHGKTPPCTEAILRARPRRVVVAHCDPFPAVSGQGIAALRSAGITVDVGLCEREARALNAPFLKRVATGRPWVIGKWAMSWDGKLATSSGDSRWISSNASRAIVHRLRGRVDAILVGRGTAERDDPLLTARPPGPRMATRIVLDSHAQLSLNSQLVRSARDIPVLLAAGPNVPVAARRALEAAGCEVWAGQSADLGDRFGELLDYLGTRGMANVLVEGGAEVLGTLFDGQYLDEVHVFMAPKLIGGREAPGPLGGTGRPAMAQVPGFHDAVYELLDRDIYARARLGDLGFYKPGR